MFGFLVWCRRIVLLVLLCVSFSQAYSQCLEVKGCVSCGRKGIKDVVVTDGIHLTKTDAKGEYRLPVGSGSEFVYISTPSGYLPERNQSRALFYHKLDKQEKKVYNFQLVKNPYDDSRHVVLVHADPQLYKLGNFEAYQTILDDCKDLIAEQGRDVFGIDCGDLVGDKPELYAPYIEAMDGLDIPFYRVLGNHDMTLYGRSHETSYAKFEELFGPSYYSFNKGKAHYVVLNDVFYLSRDYFYAGYITERQLAWLEKDLASVEPGSLVFVALHIPTRLEVGAVPFEYSNGNVAGRVSNAAFLHQILKPYRAHILSGHTHYNRNLEHSENLYEHITAAVCGTWWQGTVCLDGTPQGYGVYEVDGDDVSWYYKSSGFPKEHQFRAYPAGSSTSFPDDVLVNVWNWDSKWSVEWLENGVLMGQMIRVTTLDPVAQALCADKEKLEFKWISPMANDHMFRAPLKDKSASVEVRVTDRFGRVYQTKLN